MTIRRICLLLALLAGSAAQAQGDDASYCSDLYALARKYFRGAESGPDLGVESANADCQNGNTKRGIDYLEKKLRANGFTLPKR